MAIDVNLGLSATATGTVDVITATYSPAPTLVDRKILFLRTAGTNITTTPTFNPNGLGAKTIVKQGGAALVAGDLVGDVILMYDLANTHWELLNPKVPVVSGTNTGDETDLRIGTIINGAGSYNVAFDDSDKFPIFDVTDLPIKTTTWSNIKTRLKTYFDPIYKATFSENTAFNKNFGTTAGTVCEGNDSRLNKDKTIALTVTPASHTGNTTETVKYTVSIPANTFTTGDRIYQEILATAIGGAGVKTIRTYINDTADLITPILISTYSTNNLAYSLTSSFFVDSSSTMKSYKLGSSNAAVFTGSSNAAIGTYTIDWTVQQYLVLSVQLATGTDLIQLEALIFKRDRV